jgi:DNA polymerase-3 subunit delta
MAPAPYDTDPLGIIKKEEPGPLYYIYGKERFLVDRAVDLLRARVLDARTRDFNYELFHGREARGSTVVQAARTLPMMARRRLVLVRDVEEMKPDEQAPLAAYVAAPCRETCLVLVAEKADARLRLVAACKKHGVMLKLDPLYERQLSGFVREEARARGARFEPGAAEVLCDEVGAELGPLADAVERLAMFVGGERAISPADVEQVVASTRQRSVFELADAVGERSRERALALLGAMLSARESGVRIVALLARHVRQLWSAKELLARGRMSKFDLAQALGMPPFFVDGIEAQARRLDRAALGRMHAALYRADRALKSSRLDDARILEQLILELTPA